MSATPNQKRPQIVQPRILSGFMELLPEDQLLFNRMHDTIRRVYELHGFAPIETPAIELTEVLLAKAGGETEQQIYRFMRGDNDLMLHFDLTVPLARYVAQHEHDLVFPFRRYQIQKVWRAERAQRGRFREFYQADVDIIGTSNQLADAEIISVINAVFSALELGEFTIRLSNRKVLSGFVESIGQGKQTSSILHLVDKLDKIGIETVEGELGKVVTDAAAIKAIIDLLKLDGGNDHILAHLKSLNIDNETFTEGLAELKQVYQAAIDLGVPMGRIKIDLAIVRGLDYYTGTVFETILNDYPGIGSVYSGGRYDNLAKHYTATDLPGVGASIGLTRLFYQLKEACIIKADGASPAQVVVIATDPELLPYALKQGTELRNAGISAEVYIEPDKLAKQFKYADRLGVAVAAVIGPDEVAANSVTIRDMKTGSQQVVAAKDAVSQITKHLS